MKQFIREFLSALIKRIHRRYALWLIWNNTPRRGELIGRGYDKVGECQDWSSWHHHWLSHGYGCDMTNDRKLYIRHWGYWCEWLVPNGYGKF